MFMLSAKYISLQERNIKAEQHRGAYLQKNSS